MKGKIALITGVGRRNGIGAALCVEVAKAGVNIFFTYLSRYDHEKYPEIQKMDVNTFTDELEQLGVKVKSLELDLSKPDSVKILFDKVKTELGAPDILINNAAVSASVPFLGVTAELLDEHYAVNVRTTTLLCKEFVLQGKEGKIINLTSGQALGVMKDEIPYTITKASIEMLTQQLALEFKEHHITINAFDPGPTDTGWMDDEVKEMVKKHSSTGRINSPEDAAKQIAALLSQDITGQIINAER
ncbi:MAG: oxidoreductase [Candidatus Nomurabacteria bacterium]|nr:oxidoreductase [Candidatus Nomurabacteria bacterium]